VIEQIVVTLAPDSAELKQLIAEGWQIAHSSRPATTDGFIEYTLQRAGGARIGVQIDDSKIFIIGPDGNRRD
jgi:hypothetical protein